MTTTPPPPYDDARLQQVLDAYTDDPLRDGDVLLLLDDKVCLEVEGLADHWDDVVRRNTGSTLRDTASLVVLAIARRGADLRPSDFQLWRDVHAELRDTDVQLLPVRALPAA